MGGVIAAGHPQTAAAGAEILEQGGNAVDAAVAATFASFITESTLVNIGGGGVAQVYTPAAGQTVAFDFFSNMPGLQAVNGPNRSLDFKKVVVDFGAAKQPFYIGRGSVAVPGVVAGLGAMIEALGTLPLAQVLAPAIRLAQQGVVLTEAQAYTVRLLEPIVTNTPQISRVFAPDNRLASAGQQLYFNGLAETLTALGQQGADLFYQGNIAQEILADQQANGGLLTPTDLNSYQVWRIDPISINYRDYTILLPPLSSGGGVLIAFALKLLAAVSLQGLAHNSFEHLRVVAEVMRLTNIARAQWEEEIEQSWDGTPASSQSLTNELLSKPNISRYTEMLKDILSRDIHLTEPPQPKGPANTSHVSAADSNGMIAAITTSAGESAGFMVGNTGLMLNNMLGEIDLHRNGFHRLPPGRRLLTMMSPTLVLREGQPILAIGSGGSNRLRSAILQVISNLIDFEFPLQQAVDASRLHFEDGELQLEGGIDSRAASQLEHAGYRVNVWPARNMFFGGTHAVARTTTGNSTGWIAVGDARRGGSVVEVNFEA